MADEYKNSLARGSRNNVYDYVALTGAMAQSDGTDLSQDLIGLNVSAAGNVKVDTAAGTTITIYVHQGDNGTAVLRRVWSTGTDAVIAAGII